MLISCRFSIVGLHLLLLTKIAHSFVLLTANVDDVKKIARKFVSESLAEKIVDFIARATETMAQNTKISNSAENEKNRDAQESSQVSVENNMYNVERHGDESQAAEGKSKEDIGSEKVTVKVPKNTFVEKKRDRFEERGTTHKPRKEPKPLHGRSRYIVERENRVSLTTEKKISEEDTYSKMKKSIQLLGEKLFSTTDGNTKNKKQKKKIGRAYKLLSAFSSVENDAAKGRIPDNKETKDDETLLNIRANEKKGLSLLTEEAATVIKQNEKQTEEAATRIEQHETQTEEAATRIKQHEKQTEEAATRIEQDEKQTEEAATRIEQDETQTEEAATRIEQHEKQTEKAATDVNQHGIKDDKTTEMVATNESAHLTEKDEFDHFENKIIQKTHKVETDDKENKWWEQELPANMYDGKKKSWF